jgi:DNA-binding beta-propeller fold protein YncE
MRRGTSSLFAVGFLLLMLPGCTARDTTLKREDLFTLDIGRLEGEIDLYSDPALRQGQKSSIAMTDGLFYITNSAGRKITRYNSYGDLLFMIYNEETNPPLLDLQAIGGMTQAITRWAIAYPLQNPGAIAIDSRKNIFVADRLTSDRHRYDKETDILYDTLLLHFDANGQFVEYLGRQGKGGSPFPYIERIYLSQNDDIVVVSKTGSDYIVYWFSSNGILQHEILFNNNAVPFPEDGLSGADKGVAGTAKREKLLVSLDGIAIAPDEKIIYVKANYYRELFDETTGILSGSVPDGCSLWFFSVDRNRYVDETKIPFYENSATINGRRGNETLFYTMLGALGNREVVFFFPATNGYSILSLKAGETTRQRKRGFIDVSVEELEYSDFNLSSNGIISALLSTEWEAKVVWWRTDMLR